MFYQSYSTIFAKLRQHAIFEADNISKNYVPQKKALNRGRLKYFYSGLSFEVYNPFLFYLAQK